LSFDPVHPNNGQVLVLNDQHCVAVTSVNGAAAGTSISKEKHPSGGNKYGALRVKQAAPFSGHVLNVERDFSFSLSLSTPPLYFASTLRVAPGQNTPYHINRFLKGGYKSKGRKQAVSIPKGMASFETRPICCRSCDMHQLLKLCDFTRALNLLFGCRLVGACFAPDIAPREQ